MIRQLAPEAVNSCALQPSAMVVINTHVLRQLRHVLWTAGRLVVVGSKSG